MSKIILFINIICIIICGIIGVFTLIINPMSWFAHSWSVWILYGFPCLLTSLSLHEYCRNKYFSNINNMDKIYLASDWFHWTMFLLFCAKFAMGISFLHLFWITAHTISFFTKLLFFNNNNNKNNNKRNKEKHFRKKDIYFDIFHCIIFWVCVAGMLPVGSKVLGVLIPITGRSGTMVPSDIVIGVLTGILSIWWISGGIHFYFRLNNRLKNTFKLLLFIIWIVMLFFNMFIFEAYGKEFPKRLYFQHTKRSFINGTIDNGIWINAFDYRGLSFVKNLKNIQIFQETPLILNDHWLPWFLPLDDVITHGWWIDVKNDSPNIPNKFETKWQIINQSINENGQLLTYLHVSGPSHYALRVDTDDVIDWSFNASVFRGIDHFDFVYFACGMNNFPDIDKINDPNSNYDILKESYMLTENEPTRSEWTFWLLSNKESKRNEGKVPTIYLSSHHIHGPYVSDITNQIPTLKEDIIPHLPDWIDRMWWHSEWFEIPLSISANQK